MKKVILFSLMGFVTGHLLSQNIQSIAVGSKAPKTEVEMLDVSGKKVTINNSMDKNGVLVMFSCNTCPYVIKNQERTNQIAAYAQKNNIGVIIINSNEAYRSKDDSYEAMQAYAKEQGYKWYYTVDENATVANAFGATRTPEVFLINNQGVVIYKGAIDDNPSDAGNVKRKHLEIAIAEAVSGKEITVKESKSVGCTIKRNS